jgi:uncharacterized protein (DUF362 family)/Pyruvate/2-oxoacid:ferredoxin oxidoreductase delta subunit
MAKVIVKHSFYDYERLKLQISEILSGLCSGVRFNNSRIILKPNLLSASVPEAAITTHPLLVKAVAECIIARGGKPVICDSHAIGSFGRILETGGYIGAMKGMDVEFREFRRSVPVDIGPPFGKIELAGDALEADFIINIPKLKTHTQMLMSLGVKNMFGCVVGFRKPEWHFRTGVDRGLFARLLTQIYAAVKPGLTILDGILAMEGQGPGRSGKPRRLDLLMASDDAVALDMAVCRALGMDPACLLTNEAATDMGLAPGYEIAGDLPCIKDFVLPRMTPLIFGPPGLQRLARRYLVQRPAVIAGKCRMCMECLKFCPAGAVVERNGVLGFVYDKCIRCYCCLEVCPHGALEARDTFFSRMAGRVFRGRG